MYQLSIIITVIIIDVNIRFENHKFPDSCRNVVHLFVMILNILDLLMT